MDELKLEKRVKVFDGHVETLSHPSESTGTDMRFAVFVPPKAEKAPVPVLYWLSGLTCTEENFVTKAGAFRYAAEHGLMIVVPDTSPRGADLPGEDDVDNLGTGAGFYLNATEAPWAGFYNMYDYVVTELPHRIADRYQLSGRAGIFGHSMGGHGALVIGLRNADVYESISAFAPISAPMRSPWGQAAFSAYLGDDRETWKEYDATELIRQGIAKTPLLVDQGGSDGFLAEQLKPQLLEEACLEADHPLQLRMRPGYDHSYFFVSTFIGEHIAYHAQHLNT